MRDEFQGKDHANKMLSFTAIFFSNQGFILG